MSGITSAQIKALRETTGAGMMDCKKALIECNGDEQESKDWLRKKGLAAAAKKSSRTAAEGLIAVATTDKKAAVIELNSETDFVSKNESFQNIAQAIANTALTIDSFDALNAASNEGKSLSVENEVKELVGSLGENLNLRRSESLSVEKGVVATYIHNAMAPNLGKIGVLIALESEGDTEKLQTLGKQLAMHIAAAKPESLNIDALDPALVKRERNVFSEQAKASGKPENIIEKMVEGRIRKYYGEVVFLEQVFVIDGKATVTEAINAAEKDIGASINVKGYVRFALGEGIEKEESNFAEEVAAAAGS